MLTESTMKMLEYYNTGLRLYKEMKFSDALRSFKKALEHVPEDGPTKLYIQRCAQLSKNPPPPDWDGVYTMTTK